MAPTAREEQEALEQAEIWMGIAKRSKEGGGGGESKGANDAADWAIRRSLDALGKEGRTKGREARRASPEKRVALASIGATAASLAGGSENSLSSDSDSKAEGSTPSALSKGVAGGGQTTSGSAFSSLSRSDLDKAIEAGDWERVGEITQGEGTRRKSREARRASSEKRAGATAADTGAASGGWSASSSLSRSGLDRAIEAGDWDKVGEAAALLAAGPEGDSLFRSDNEAEVSTSNELLKDRAAELDHLVDQGDWEGVVAAAAKFNTVENEKATAVQGEVPGVTQRHASSRDQRRVSRELRSEVESLVRSVVPEEIDNVDEMIQQFHGREDELVETLRTMKERAIAQKLRRASTEQTQTRIANDGGKEGGEEKKKKKNDKKKTFKLKRSLKKEAAKKKAEATAEKTKTMIADDRDKEEGKEKKNKNDRNKKSKLERNMKEEAAKKKAEATAEQTQTSDEEGGEKKIKKNDKKRKSKLERNTKEEATKDEGGIAAAASFGLGDNVKALVQGEVPTSQGRANRAPTQKQPPAHSFTPQEQAAVAALSKNVDILGQLRKLTPDEQKAVAVLAKNIQDFERSLESVRGLPETLEGASPEAKAYFRTFAASFERTFVAARAISSGAVKVQLSSAKDQMLEGVLKAIGGFAEGCGVPFVGLISIVAAVLLYQRETRQANLLGVFQDFFEGHSRDHYLVTYRKLVEQICLRSDFAEYSSRNKGQIKQDRVRVRKILKPLKKRLQSSQLLMIDDLQPVEIKATADLAALTKGVLQLHQDDRRRFCALKDGGDEEKIKYLLCLLGLPASSVHSAVAHQHSGANSAETDGNVTQSFSSRPSPSPSTASESVRHSTRPTSSKPSQSTASESVRHSTRTTSSRPIQSTASESVGHSAPTAPQSSSRFQEIEGDIRRLREQNRRLLSGNRRTEALQRRLDRLERRVGNEADTETGAGGNAQVQAQLQRSRNAHSREGAIAESAAYQEVLLELRELRAGLAEVAERTDVANFNTFLLSQVLQEREVLELVEAVLRLAGVEISASGGFKLDGKRHKLGFVSSGFLSKPKYLWKDTKGVKVSQEYNGAKPVVYWFEKCGLNYLYAKHIKAATMKVFKAELLLVSSGDNAAVQPNMGTSQNGQNGQQLFQ